jgi:hypothetical protein
MILLCSSTLLPGNHYAMVAIASGVGAPWGTMAFMHTPKRPSSMDTTHKRATTAAI